MTGTRDETAWFETEALRQRLQLTAHLVENSPAAVVVTAPPGGGRSAFLARLLAEAPDHWRGCLVRGHEAAGEPEVTAALAACLGAEADAHALRPVVEGLTRSGQRVVVAVDDADELDESALTLLAGLAGAGARLVLAGPPELAESLAAGPLAGLQRQHMPLPAFTEVEAVRFLRERLVRTHRDAPADDAELRRAWAACKGLPGRLMAYLEASATVGRRDEAAEAGAAPAGGAPARPRRGWVVAAVAALATLAVGAGLWRLLGLGGGAPRPLEQALPLPDEPGRAHEAAATGAPGPAAPPPPPRASSRKEPGEGETGAARVPEGRPETREAAGDGPAAAGAPPERLAAATVEAVTEGAQRPAPAGGKAATEDVEAYGHGGTKEELPPSEAEHEGAASGAGDAAAPGERRPRPPDPAGRSSSGGAERPAGGEGDAPVPVQPKASPTAETGDAGPLGPAWVMAQPAEAWTVQVLGASRREALLAYARRHRFPPGPLAWLETRRAGRPWFVLLHGRFSDKAAARAAVRRLPAAVRRAGPWPRRFGELQRIAVGQRRQKAR